MFIHNLKYTIKTLFKNKVLIFWTFAFPIILGMFFNMAFSNIEKDEELKVFDIAIINNKNNENNIYYETLLKYSDGKDKLFNIKSVNKDEANNLLDKGNIKGYVYFLNDEPHLVIKENGLEQTLLKYILTEINESKNTIEDLTKKSIEKEIKDGNYGYKIESIINDIVDKTNENRLTLKNISNSNLSYMQVEYYTLIAMACMYGGMLGLTALNNCLANMSKKGKRISISPAKKSTIILSSALGSYIVSLSGISILIIFLKLILKVSFGSNFYLILLLTLIGDLAGISLGILISSLFKLSEGAKIGITISISMFLSVLSGMMGVTLKYVIDKNFKIINLINPNNLITDGFYSIYYYNTLDRYFRDIKCLVIFIIVCLLISFISLRRQKYDSI